VLIHHVVKAREGRSGLDSVRGSGEFVAFARNVVMVDILDVGDPERRVLRLAVDGNKDIGQRERAVEIVRVQRDGREVVQVVDLGDPAQIGSSTPRSRVLAFLRANGDVYASGNELYDAMKAAGKGMAKPTFLGAFKELQENGAVIRVAGKFRAAETAVTAAGAATDDAAVANEELPF
jgi:hypothetical protein